MCVQFCVYVCGSLSGLKLPGGLHQNLSEMFQPNGECLKQRFNPDRGLQKHVRGLELGGGGGGGGGQGGGGGGIAEGYICLDYLPE